MMIVLKKTISLLVQKLWKSPNSFHVQLITKLTNKERFQGHSELFERDRFQSLEHPQLSVQNFYHICWGALGAEIKRLKVFSSVSNPNKK